MSTTAGVAIDELFERPILSSPYERPTRHWEVDESGQPTQPVGAPLVIGSGKFSRRPAQEPSSATLLSVWASPSVARCGRSTPSREPDSRQGLAA